MNKKTELNDPLVAAKSLRKELKNIRDGTRAKKRDLVGRSYVYILEISLSPEHTMRFLNRDVIPKRYRKKSDLKTLSLAFIGYIWGSNSGRVGKEVSYYAGVIEPYLEKRVDPETFAKELNEKGSDRISRDAATKRKALKSNEGKGTKRKKPGAKAIVEFMKRKHLNDQFIVLNAGSSKRFEEALSIPPMAEADFRVRRKPDKDGLVVLEFVGVRPRRTTSHSE